MFYDKGVRSLLAVFSILLSHSLHLLFPNLVTKLVVNLFMAGRTRRLCREGEMRKTYLSFNNAFWEDTKFSKFLKTMGITVHS